GAARDRLFVKELFDAIFELIRLLLAHVLDPRAVMSEGRMRESLFDERVVDPIELEREEEEMRRSRGDLFLDVAVKFGAFRIGGIACVYQARVGNELAEQLLQRLELLHGGGEIFARIGTRGIGSKLAFMAFLEGNALRIRACEIGRKLRRIDRGIK